MDILGILKKCKCPLKRWRVHPLGWVSGDSITGGWWTAESRQFPFHHSVQFCQSLGLSSTTRPLHCPVAARWWWVSSAYRPLHSATMGEKAGRGPLAHLWKMELRLLMMSSGPLLPLTPLTSPLDSKHKSQGRPLTCPMGSQQDIQESVWGWVGEWGLTSCNSEVAPLPFTKLG